MLGLVAKQSEVENLGLMYLAAVANGNGEPVTIYYDDGFLNVEHIMADSPDWVGFQVYTGNHKRMFQLADDLRSLKNPPKVAMGGPHATFFYDDCRKHADSVKMGEAMKTIFTDEVSCLLEEDPDKFPFPVRQEGHKKIANIMTSFGCPFSCNYCYNSQYRKLYPGQKATRQRSVESVCREAYDIDADLIFFQDDCFGWDVKWLKEFAKQWGIRPYHAQIRIDTVTEEKLKLLINSGCNSITYAIESYDPEVRDKMLGRPMEHEKMVYNMRLVKASGLRIRTEQMLGLPMVSLEDEINLLRLNCEIAKPEIAWTSIYQPYLGTKLGDWCKEHGLYNGNNDDICDNFFTESVLNFSDKRKEEIKRLNSVFNLLSQRDDGWEAAQGFVQDGNFGDYRRKCYDKLYWGGKDVEMD